MQIIRNLELIVLIPN